MSSDAGRRPLNFKKWVVAVLFGAIIVVFVFWGVHPERWEATSGGVAAVVNNETISIAEFRQRAENQAASLQGRMDQFPPAQRQLFERRIREQVLNDLIFGELMYQAGAKKGFSAVDAEVRDQILDIPYLKENGRFVRERYDALLSNLRFSSDEFENQIRKQLIAQKLQELLTGAMQPSTLEVQRMEQLRGQRVALRYALFSREDLGKKGFVADADVETFVKSTQGAQEIEKYYNDNKVQFETPEQITARHILISVNEKRTEADALKLASELKGKLTVGNFAQLAAEYSDDPGSKKRGGSLDSFSRGRMVPGFENVAFELAPGKISEPTKTEYGYHLILVDKKTPAVTQTLAQARDEIGRRLLARSQAQSIIARLGDQLKSAPGGVEAALARSGIQFQETGEFDLASSTIPRIGENPSLMSAVMGLSGKTGWLPKIIESGDQIIVANVTSWKSGGRETTSLDTIRRSLAYRKSSQLMDEWAKEAQAKASIVRNERLLQ